MVAKEACAAEPESTSPGNISVRLVDIVKQFGATTVVPKMNLDIHEGEFVVLLGGSGCGKSTTLRIIAGLEEPTSGQVFIEGQEVTDVPPKDRNVAMVFQDYALYPNMSVYGNMAFSLRLRRLPKLQVRESVEKAARILHIKDLLDRKPRDLSGGQRQRVAIGRAIVREPNIFLFDEPLSNLDAKLRSHMRAELAMLHKRLGKTTIYVTHDQTEAMTLATRIIVIDHGRVQQDGSPDDVFNRPRNLFVATFIGSPAMNVFRAEVERDAAGTLHFVGSGLRNPVPRRFVEAGLAEGRRCNLGIRPQSLSLADEASQHAILMDVAVVENLGTECVLVGHLVGDPDTRVSALLQGSHANLTKQQVPLAFGEYDLHVFDAQSGEAF